MNTLFKLTTIAGIAVCFASCQKGETEYDASGVFEATEVTVSARSQGEILSLRYDEGDEVKLGDTLGVIDSRQLSLKKQQLQSNRQANDARRLDLESQIASLKQQIQNAQKEKARFLSLLADKAATQKQVDDISYQISVLEKQVSALTVQVNSQNQSISSQSQGIGSQISQVDEQLSDAVVTAPLSGTVLMRYCEPGEYAAPGRAIFKIANLSDMTLRAYVSADQLTTLKLGQKVTVFADEGKADRKAYDGKVTWISQKAEFTPKTIQTRDERANLVYAVKISVKNDGQIKSGMYGDVAFK